MAKYEPGYVSQLAELMMAEAARIILVRTIVYGVVGLIVGLFMGQAYGGTSAMMAALLLGAVGAVLGRVTARGVLLLRAQAQMLLTQLQIETNTRPR